MLRCGHNVSVICLHIAAVWNTVVWQCHALLPTCHAIEELRGSTLPMASGLFYTSSISYLNAATLGPMARPVLECAVESWKDLESDPCNKYPWEAKSSPLDGVLQHAATMLHCRKDELALVPSTTVALNLIGEGLVATGYLRPTDRVLTTDQEHKGGVSVWQHWTKMKKLGGVDRVALPVGDDLTPKSILDVFREKIHLAKGNGIKYSVVSVSHVLTTTGARLPLPELASMVHSAGAILIADGAQGPGNLAVNLEKSGVDAYTVSAHKWLLAPTGSGLLYIQKGVEAMIQPAQLAGGYHAYTQNAGTVPLQTIAGLGYALDLMDAFGGLGAVESHGLQMANYTHTAALRQLEGVSVLSPIPNSGSESCIVTMALPKWVSNSIVTRRLKSEFGVVVKELPDKEGGSPLIKNCIRVSHHVYTSQHDVDRLIAGLSTILMDSVDTATSD